MDQHEQQERNPSTGFTVDHALLDATRAIEAAYLYGKGREVAKKVAGKLRNRNSESTNTTGSAASGESSDDRGE